MASTGWFWTGSGPACGFNCTATASRSGSTVKVSWKIEARIQYSSTVVGSPLLGTGYTITATIKAGGKTATANIKTTSETWNNNNIHTKSGTLSFTDTSTTSTNVAFSSTSNMTSTGKFSTKNVKVTYSSYASVPGHVASISASPTSIKPDGSFTLSWTAGSNGGASIDKYNVDTRRYTGGAWSAWTNNGGNGLTSGSTTLNGRSLYSTLMPGETIQCRVAVHNSVGWDSQDGRPTISITAYKDGKIMVKDVNGTVREITRIKVKDTGGTVRDIQKVKIKDTSGTIRNIDLYWI